MELKFLILVLALLAVYTTKFSADAAPDYCNNSTQGVSATSRLRKNLLCNYDRTVRARFYDDRTRVSLSLFPKFINFDEDSNTMIFHAWLGMSWPSPNLMWRGNNPRLLHVTSDEIWVPPIAHYNSAGGSRSPNGIPKTDCFLSNYGYIGCVADLKYVSNCVTDYRNWPFDRHNCTIVLASWTYKEEEIKYLAIDHKHHFPAIGMFDFTPNAQWKMLSFQYTQREDGIAEGYTFPTIIYTVVIERNSASMGTAIFAPVILLVILTLTVLWLDPISVERSVVSVLNLICNLICVMNLNEQVPFNGSTTPSICRLYIHFVVLNFKNRSSYGNGYIFMALPVTEKHIVVLTTLHVVFHQGSIVIANVALLLTILLRQMKKTSVSPPDWLTLAIASILASRAGQLIVLTTLDPKAVATVRAGEDNIGLATSNDSSIKIETGNKVWRHLAVLLDRLAFATVLLTYLIMITVLIPRNDVFEVPDVPSLYFMP